LLIGVDIRPLFGPFLAPLYFVITIFYLDLMDSEKSKKLISAFIYISVIIFTIEALWRILHPATPSLEALSYSGYRWFYKYKVRGLMYAESNAVAIHIIVILFFTYWWGEYLRRRFIWVKILLMIVLFLTFSRAAIVSFSIGILYFTYIRKMKRISFQLLILFAIALLLFIFPIYIQPLLEKDQSTSQKIILLREIPKYYSKADWINIVFGIGNYKSKEIFSIYAHNYILVYLIEMGIIGVSILLLQFLYFVHLSKKDILVMLIPFLAQVMSSTTIFIPYFYMCSAIIIYFSRKQKVGYMQKYMGDIISNGKSKTPI
jgi:hypothetical protein